MSGTGRHTGRSALLKAAPVTVYDGTSIYYYMIFKGVQSARLISALIKRAFLA
ncbi:MAG: hypothetical protein JRJ15_02455 [Deltaproteobacteria bacterium]|nr:hypothetical protein [Deltaproteobacteria bacterium]